MPIKQRAINELSMKFNHLSKVMDAEGKQQLHEWLKQKKADLESKEPKYYPDKIDEFLKDRGY